MKSVERILLVVVAILSCLATTSRADQAEETKLIEQAIASYTAAFNAGDAEALAAHWSPEAVYVNPLTGSQVEGREAITEEFKLILSQMQDTKLTVDLVSVRFISPSVAVEDGVAHIHSADGQLQTSNYTAIHVKRDKQWLLDRVTEEAAPVILSHYEQLKDLEWLIGTWVDDDGQSRIETTCRWTQNRNFITRSFSVSNQGRVEMTGFQLIGWDPAQRQIRSWVFDSDGGFAEGRWTNKENQWYVTTSGTLPDGGKASSVNVISMVDNDQFKWRSLNRTVRGKLLPNIDEVVIVRSQSAE